MIQIILNFFNWLLMLVGVLGVVGIVFLIPGIIIAFVVLSKEKDEAIRKKKTRKAIFFACMPFVMVVGALIGTVLLNVIKAFITK